MNTGGALLVIEDDPDVARAARIALRDCCESIQCLSSPATLEDALASTQFDAVLLDMNFVTGERSGSGGLDALARIRAADDTLAVVLMTAYGGVTLAVEALKRGASDFLLKPWYNEKLVAAVVAAAQITHARRAARPRDLDSVERETIARALEHHGGNVSLAAAALGLSRGALYRRLAKHGLQD